MLTIDDILAARNRIDRYIHRTPILTSSLLNSWLGHEIFFKAECFQKIGAFKARGACNAIAYLREQNIPMTHVVANSSGNHAQAVAWATNRFAIPATIFMPVYSSKVKIQATRAYGATPVLLQTRAEVDEQVKQAAKEKGTFLIHPYNDEQVICGQGTATLEAIETLGKVDAVLAPCGGGGLLSGTLIAAHGLAPKATVIGAEPLNANDAAQSLRMGTIQSLTGLPDTLADGAMTPFVGDITFEYLKRLDEMYEIEEDRIAYWTQWLSHLLKIRVEPTSALPMEAAHQWLKKQTSKKRVLVILSGGNVDQLTELKIWNKNYLENLPG